nr:RNA-directed DNA polymerase, eukaryota [Tanacetum cinerariifolium]
MATNYLVLCLVVTFFALSFARPTHFNLSKVATHWADAAATWYGSPDGFGSDGGSCGYGTAVSQAPFSSMVTGIGPSLYNNGKECGACYDVDLFNIKSCWVNLNFNSVVSPSVGNSGDILCVWDPIMFHKENSTVSDYFIAIMGKWLPNDKNLLIISVYTPQELAEKKMLWQYLNHVIDRWNGDVNVMGDFNEVLTVDERFGSIFNARGAAAFTSFISAGGLLEIASSSRSVALSHL